MVFRVASERVFNTDFLTFFRKFLSNKSVVICQCVNTIYQHLSILMPLKREVLSP